MFYEMTSQATATSAASADAAIASKSKIRSNKNTWSQDEDIRLIELVDQYGANNWTVIASELGSGKRSKQCRERYHNHLQADIKKGGWTEEEERLIFELQAEYGNQWAKIAVYFPGRTDNSIKNRFNSMMRSMQHKQMKALQKQKQKQSQELVAHCEQQLLQATPSIASSDSTNSASSSGVLYSISATAPPKRHPLVPTLALGTAKPQIQTSLTIAVSSSRSNSSSSSIKLSPYNFESSRSLLDMAQFAMDGDVLETVRSTTSFEILRAILDDSDVESSDDDDNLDLLLHESIVPFSARDFDFGDNGNGYELDSSAASASLPAADDMILNAWWEERDVLFDLGSVMKRIEISPRQSTLTPRMTPRSPFLLNMKKQRGCAY